MSFQIPNRTHNGAPLDPGTAFPSPPSADIGQILSVSSNVRSDGHQTTLFEHSVARRQRRVLIGIVGVVVGAVVLLMVAVVPVKVSAAEALVYYAFAVVAGLGSGVFSGALTWFFSRPTARYSYVGTRGAELVRRTSFGQVRRSFVRYADIAECYVSRTQNYYNGAYIGTTLAARFVDQGRSTLKLHFHYSDPNARLTIFGGKQKVAQPIPDQVWWLEKTIAQCQGERLQGALQKFQTEGRLEFPLRRTLWFWPRRRLVLTRESLQLEGVVKWEYPVGEIERLEVNGLRLTLHLKSRRAKTLALVPQVSDVPILIEAVQSLRLSRVFT